MGKGFCCDYFYLFFECFTGEQLRKISCFLNLSVAIYDNYIIHLPDESIS